MSTGLYNRDRSFFSISSPDLVGARLIAGRDLVSLTVNERMGQIDQGSIRLNDPNHQYSRLLRIGVEVTVEWGYDAPEDEQRERVFRSRNPNELRGGFSRSITGIVQSPKGAASEGGEVTYDCSFLAIQFRGGSRKQSYTSGTKGAIVARVMGELGIAEQIIDFERQGELATEAAPVYQYESDFQFLLRLSREWRAAFKVGYRRDGTLVGLFANPERAGISAFKNSVTGAEGLSNYFQYGGRLGNVVSYEWKNNQGDRGVGAGANLQIVNGEIQIQRYTVETDSVQTWKLNEQRLEDELERVEAEGGQEAKNAFYLNYLQARDFEEVERFFDPVEVETAPQGYGYSVSMQTLGNPLITVSNPCEFGDGFPTMIGNPREFAGRQITWYVNGVSHSLSRAGYRCSVEVVDQYAISPTGQVVL